MKYGINSNGIIYAIIRDNKDFYTQKLTAISLEKGKIWTFDEKITYPNELRICKKGNAFISTNNKILEINEGGEILNEIKCQVHQSQEIGSFLIEEENLVVCFQGKEKPNSEIRKINKSGDEIWKTKITSNIIAYKGIVSLSAKNNWKPKPVAPWQPEKWKCLNEDEILISNDKILVSYFDMPRSGIGISYCLDKETGEIVWQTKPISHHSIGISENGNFIISCLGYDAFNTKEFSLKGEKINKWKSAGDLVISNKNEKFIIEYSNETSYLTELMTNKEVKRYCKLLDFHTIYPVIDELGNIAFWRNNELTVINQAKEMEVLFRNKIEEREYCSHRILLYGNGKIIFSQNEILYIVQTTLSKLAKSSWACGFGNNERNPIYKK